MDGIAPHAASSSTGFVFSASHAAASAFHSSAFLSGLYSSIGSFARSASGSRRAASSAVHAGDLLGLARLALDRRERRAQRVRRRLPVAALALLVEVHRRRVQQQRDGRGLRGRRLAAVVLARELVEAELGVAARVPQERRVEFRRELLRLGQRVAGAGRGEAQQHVAGLDLQPLAGHRLDLQRRIVVGENGAGLQLAVVLEQDIHDNLDLRGGRGRSGPARCGDRCLGNGRLYGDGLRAPARCPAVRLRPPGRRPTARRRVAPRSRRRPGDYASGDASGGHRRRGVSPCSP